METVVAILIPAIVENVFGALTEAVSLSDWLRQCLGRDLEKLAFRLALPQELSDAAPALPNRDLRYLTRLWLNHLTIDSAIYYR